MPCEFRTMSAADYHADKIGDQPTLSASLGRVLISQSPFHAWLRHPKMGGVRERSTSEQNNGTLLHALVLGEGREDIVVIDADNFRTKAAQELRDAASDAGKVPILKKDMAQAERSAAAVISAIEDAGLHLGGVSEQVAVWEEETGSGLIQCRARMDHTDLGTPNMPVDTPFILDLKTTSLGTDPESAAATIAKSGYDLQRAAYLSAVERIRPDLAGRIRFVWVFVEELPFGSPFPVLVSMYEAGGSMRELGKQKWFRACEKWGECWSRHRTRPWPAYNTNNAPLMLEAPEWAMKRELEAA